MRRSARQRFLLLVGIFAILGLYNFALFFIEVLNTKHTQTSLRLDTELSSLGHQISRKHTNIISSTFSEEESDANNNDDDDDDDDDDGTKKRKSDTDECDGDGECSQKKPAPLFKIKPDVLHPSGMNKTLLTDSSSHLHWFSLDQLQSQLMRDGRLLNKSYFRVGEKELNSLPQRIHLHNPGLCTLPCGKSTYLLVIVPSVLNHTNDRATIRDTWASSAYNKNRQWANTTLTESMRVLFVLGSRTYSEKDIAFAQKEAEIYGDLLLSDFIDSYRNLSVKMAVGLAWTSQYCSDVKHVLKVDEDTFVFMPKMLSIMKWTEQSYEKFVMGAAHRDMMPLALRTGKWKVSPEVYPLDIYPRYAYGHSYIMSGPAVKTILYAYLRMPLVRNEDVLFTGILPVATGVARLSHHAFARAFRHEFICHVAHGVYASVTGCCNVHHHQIFQDIQQGICNSKKTLNEVNAPNCRFRPKQKTKVVKKVKKVIKVAKQHNETAHEAPPQKRLRRKVKDDVMSLDG